MTCLLNHLEYLPTAWQVLLPVAANCEEKGQSALILNTEELTGWRKGSAERFVINYAYTLGLSGRGKAEGTRTHGTPVR